MRSGGGRSPVPGGAYGVTSMSMSFSIPVLYNSPGLTGRILYCVVLYCAILHYTISVSLLTAVSSFTADSSIDVGASMFGEGRALYYNSRIDYYYIILYYIILCQYHC